MSSVDVNDENRGVYPGGKYISSNDDIFALDEPTGRPSILRQTENLPNKTVPKGIKVCFQTPRRDPVTKKILSPNKSVKMTSVDECTAAMESLNLDKTKVSPQETSKEPDEPKQASSYPDDVMPIKSKGGYQLDFDNLDAINPFGGSNKMALSPARPVAENPTTDQAESQHTKAENPLVKPAKTESALDETLPFMSSVENSLADVSANISSTESSVVTVVKSQAADSCTATPDEKMSPSPDQAKASGSFVEDVPLPVKGTYSLDFDAINPFQTGGSKILNSPLCERKLLDNNAPPDEPQAEENKPVDMENVGKVVQEVSVQTEVKPLAVAAIFTNTAKPPAAESQPAVDPSKEGPVRLEFNFDDGNEIKCKPPPKKFSKRPSGEKPKEGKPVSDVKSPKQAAEKPPTASDVADVPIPKGSYAFDLDKFDDPNFNPFGTTSSINNSPKCSKKLSPELMETAIPEQRGKPEEKEVVLSACAGENVPVSDPNAKMITELKAASDHQNQLHPETEQFMQSFPEPSQLFPPAQTQSQTTMLEVNEEFVPGATFMANDFDDQIDYLEQFGSSSFKESALRKQSLYLKFDPLLRESPKKSAGPTAQTHVPRPTAFVSRLETPMADNEATKRSQKDEFKPFDATAPTSSVFKSLVPPFPQPTNAEDAIFEVLKYSQKDMDAAIAKVQAEAKEKEEQWSAKYNELLGDAQEMRKVVAEYELVIAKMMADQEKTRKVAQAKVDDALLEKDKVSNDLDAVERSFSELFKRLEKYKEVIEGYKKNEEVLKACAQDYLARIKMDKQRYQTLKAHAEEKIGHANEEIAEVRSKYKAEISALQAQLRREQLKVQSLENSLDQKEKEVKELAVLCDELINKVQKG